MFLNLMMFQRKDLSGFIYINKTVEGKDKPELIRNYLNACHEMKYELFPNELPFIIAATEDSELINICEHNRSYKVKFYV